MDVEPYNAPTTQDSKSYRVWRKRAGKWVVVTYTTGRDVARRGRTRLSLLSRRVAAIGFLTLLTVLASFSEVLNYSGGWIYERCRVVGICDRVSPPVLIGELSEVRVGASALTLQEAYAERSLATPSALMEEGGSGTWPGQLITYRVEFQGMQKSVCSVRWTLYDAATGQRMPNPTNGWETVHVIAFPDGTWTVEAHESDVNIGLVWVPYVAAGTFIVEIELIDPDGYHLDIERTEAFMVKSEALPDSDTLDLEQLQVLPSVLTLQMSPVR